MAPKNGPEIRMTSSNPHIVFWGTYDLGKPRTRLLIDYAARTEKRTEIHKNVWAGVEDKSRIHGRFARLRLLLKWLTAYPGLILRYLRAPRHDAVVVLYMGHLDILMIWPWARLRGAVIVWDVLLTAYETVVDDRALIRPDSWLARLVWAWDWLALRAADCAVLPSSPRRDLAAERFGIPCDRLAVVPIGVEAARFPPTAPLPPHDPGQLRILFYAQFAPMHGLGNVVAAARLAVGSPYRWRFIGRGQDDWHLSEWLDKDRPPRVTWVDSVPYEQLAEEIRAADVCLGVFGDTIKAFSSAPNKLFQVLATGRALVTRDTPAVREVLDPGQAGVYLVEDGKPESILAALNRAWSDRAFLRQGPLHQAWRERFAPQYIGDVFTRVILETIGQYRRDPKPAKRKET